MGRQQQAKARISPSDWLSSLRHEADASPRRLATAPLLEALRAAGTRHVYGDTADVGELARTIVADDGAMLEAVDGNTVNQPLVRKVVERLVGDLPLDHVASVLAVAGDDPRASLPWVYAILCARIGRDMTHAFAAGRAWEVSLQLHMDLAARREDAVRVGRFVHDMVPNALVKVPFAPDRPQCLLAARDLERAGVPVNLTSTFSARQVAIAALLVRATRTNVFLGRLEQGLEAERLGEHVVLEAQRALHALREHDRVPTQLIAASMRDWRTFDRLAGCDVFTAPCGVLGDFLAQREIAPEDIRSRLETPSEFRVSARVAERVGHARLARLFTVEPEFVAFLRDVARRVGAAEPRDGDDLYRQFDTAGFGDVFHAPTDAERAEARAGKLPDLDGTLIGHTALDTHYSLLANADFEKYQAEIDEQVERHS